MRTKLIIRILDYFSEYSKKSFWDTMIPGYITAFLILAMIIIPIIAIIIVIRTC